MKKGSSLSTASLLALGAALYILLWSGQGDLTRPLAPGALVNPTTVNRSTELSPLADAMRQPAEPVTRTAAATALAETSDAAPTDASLASSEDLDPQVMTGTVRVEVREAGSGKLAKGAVVELLDGTKFESGLGWDARKIDASGPDGLIWFREVSVGQAVVMLLSAASRQGQRPVMVAVEPGKTTELAFLVDETQRTTGYVVDANKQRVSGAEIWRVHNEGAHQRLARSAADGTFEIPYLPRTTRLSATFPGHVASSRWVVGIMGGKDAPAVLRLMAERGRVFGRVVDEDGDAVPRARLALAQMRGNSMPHVQNGVSGTDGTFKFADVAVGNHVLDARIPGTALTQLEVTVTDGGHHELGVRLWRGGVVRGQLTTSGGHPVSNALVTPERPRERLRTSYARTDAEGRFELRDQPQGEARYRVDSDAGQELAGATLTIVHGQTTEWNPVATEPTRLHGLLRSSSGTPLAQWAIYAQPMRGSEAYPGWMTGRTDASGRFDVTPPPGATYRIRVFAPGKSREEFALEVEDIDPLSVPLDLVVPEAAIPR